MPLPNGPSHPKSSCPYFARFRPGGRDYTYELCEATGAEPFVPSQTELTELCQGDFARCPRYRAAREREVAAADGSDQRAA